RLVRLRALELDAVRAVDGHRVDAQPLQRLEDRLPGAAEERDALLGLAALRRPLEHEDVRDPMARPEHRRAVGARTRDLVAELVDLADRLAEIPVVDLVVRRSHGAF